MKALHIPCSTTIWSHLPGTIKSFKYSICWNHNDDKLESSVNLFDWSSEWASFSSFYVSSSIIFRCDTRHHRSILYVICRFFSLFCDNIFDFIRWVEFIIFRVFVLIQKNHFCKRRRCGINYFSQFSRSQYIFQRKTTNCHWNKLVSHSTRTHYLSTRCEFIDSILWSARNGVNILRYCNECNCMCITVTTSKMACEEETQGHW